MPKDLKISTLGTSLQIISIYFVVAYAYKLGHIGNNDTNWEIINTIIFPPSVHKNKILQNTNSNKLQSFSTNMTILEANKKENILIFVKLYHWENNNMASNLFCKSMDS